MRVYSTSRARSKPVDSDLAGRRDAPGRRHGASGRRDAHRLTGAAGVNTLIVSAGAILLATGDLGDGNDVLDVAGTLDTGGGTFLLGAGDDAFVVHDTTRSIGTLDAGAGDDLLNVNIDAGNLVQLEQHAPASSRSASPGSASSRSVAPPTSSTCKCRPACSMPAAGGNPAPQTATVRRGGTLNVDGSFQVHGRGRRVHGRRHCQTAREQSTCSMATISSRSSMAPNLAVLQLRSQAARQRYAHHESHPRLRRSSGVSRLRDPHQAGSQLVAASPVSPPSSLRRPSSCSQLARASPASSHVSRRIVDHGRFCATLNVDGTLHQQRPGNDTFTVAGTVDGRSSVDLGAGDDVVRCGTAPC